MGPRRATLGIVAVCSFLSPAVAAAQAPSRELLLFMAVPTVVTPTRRPQSLMRAPSNITVITAEDIRLSGATNIPDVLRNVPGLDIFRVSVSDVNVAGRGLNERAANRLQVFIDGRSVLQDLFNLVFWEQLPLSLSALAIALVDSGSKKRGQRAGAAGEAERLIRLQRETTPIGCGQSDHGHE